MIQYDSYLMFGTGPLGFPRGRGYGLRRRDISTDYI